MFDPDLFELENNDFINFFSDEAPAPPEELPEVPEPMKYNYSIPEAPKLKKRKRGCFYIHKGIKRYWNGKEFLCEHKKQKTRCTDCGGEGFCEHNKRIENCKDCGKKYFCIHDRKKNSCGKCKGSAMCHHGRRKQYCKDCGGASICIHGRQKYHCTDCGGKGICIHKKTKWKCKICMTFKKSG
jgi:hypothetical protein